MPAEVIRESLRTYIAWCDDCQDGVRWSTKAYPSDWAAEHNRDRHPESKED